MKISHLRYFVAIVLLLLGGIRDVPAQTFSYYDLETLGIPKFVNSIHIDLSKIRRISKFRSSAGHDYHDDFESCRSMKHYFIQPDETTVIRSPIAGTVYRLTTDELGSQIQFRSDFHQAITVVLFHVKLAKPLAIGDHVDEGQVLGTHASRNTFSDIAVSVDSTKGYRRISFFDVLTEAGFAPFKARGLTSPSQMIFTKAERDAEPYACEGEGFVNLKVAPETEYVILPGADPTQSITTSVAGVYYLSSSPVLVSANATSDLPVAITSATPAICTVTANRATLLAAGICKLAFNQPGNFEYSPAPTVSADIDVRADGAVGPSTLIAGPIFSSAQAGAQSFLRFRNTDVNSGIITLILKDYATGQLRGQWTSPSIPAGSSQQFSISTIENDIGISTAKPAYYSVSLHTSLVGHFQHVLWRPADGTLTNLSTCSTGIQAFSRLQNVHSSLLDFGYPSSVVLTNTRPFETLVNLGLYNAATGIRLATYQLPVQLRIPANGQITIPIATIETASGISPSSNNFYHYNIDVETQGAFAQHLVNNKQSGVITDMSASCPVNSIIGSAATSALRIGSIYSTAQRDSQSFLRFYNTASTAGTLSVTLWNAATGASIGRWTSPSIPPGSAQQYSIATIENEIGSTFTKPTLYVASVQSTLTGAFQHVLWRATDGTLTNLSTCENGATTYSDSLNNVHSSLFDSGYPSTVAIVNTGASAASVTLGIYNAATGAAIGTYRTPTAIPIGGQTIVPIAVMEAVAGVSPGTTVYHYVIKAESAFSGFLQHLVDNKQSGVVTDMTTVCQMN